MFPFWDATHLHGLQRGGLPSHKGPFRHAKVEYSSEAAIGQILSLSSWFVIALVGQPLFHDPFFIVTHTFQLP